MNMLRGILIKIYTAINKEKTFENVKTASFHNKTGGLSPGCGT